jgi:hypothetical protein
MKRIRIVGLCLVAVFALSAIVAGGASAASPEYKTCIKATEKTPEKTYKDGEFSDKACGTPSPGGKYKLGAWNAGKKKFAQKGKGGKGANIQYNPETNSPIGDTECASEKITGEVTGPKESRIQTEYKGCKTNEGKNCTSGAKKGVIVTKELSAVLVPIGSSEGDGIAISPKTGSVLAEYECEGISIVATGGVIGEIVGAGKAANKEPTFVFQHGPGLYQQWGYVGENEAETFTSFKSFFETGKPTPNALILSTVKIPALKVEFTAPATQENVAVVKGEPFKIV